MSIRRLSYIVDQISSIHGGGKYGIYELFSFNPAEYIAVANRLIPEGKDAILAAMRRVRVDTRREGLPLDNVDLLLRLLFRSPGNKGFRPAPFLLLNLDNPINWKQMPTFPMVMIGDIPLYGAMGTYAGPGPYIGQDKRLYLEDVQRRGVLRQTLLQPAPKPWLVLDKLMASPEWYWSKNCRKPPMPRPEVDRYYQRNYEQGTASGKQEVRRQILRAVAPVYPSVKRFTELHGDDIQYAAISEADWAKCCRDLTQMNLEWNMQKGHYEAQLK